MNDRKKIELERREILWKTDSRTERLLESIKKKKDMSERERKRLEGSRERMREKGG
jgi:hypothetical protein